MKSKNFKTGLAISASAALLAGGCSVGEKHKNHKNDGFKQAQVEGMLQPAAKNIGAQLLAEYRAHPDMVVLWPDESHTNGYAIIVNTGKLALMNQCSYVLTASMEKLAGELNPSTTYTVDVAGGASQCYPDDNSDFDTNSARIYKLTESNKWMGEAHLYTGASVNFGGLWPTTNNEIMAAENRLAMITQIAGDIVRKGLEKPLQ